MAHDDLLIANAAAGSTILIANGGGGNLLIAPSTPEPPTEDRTGKAIIDGLANARDVERLCRKWRRRGR